MFKAGFGSYTKTGRSIAIGRACGESWARQRNTSSSSNEKRDINKDDDGPICAGFIIIALLSIIFYTIVQSKRNLTDNTHL